MKKRKLGIIGGSGLYKMDGFEKTKWKKINTSWGKPSDEVLIATLGKEEICFIITMVVVLLIPHYTQLLHDL